MLYVLLLGKHKAYATPAKVAGVPIPEEIATETEEAVPLLLDEEEEAAADDNDGADSAKKEDASPSNDEGGARETGKGFSNIQ